MRLAIADPPYLGVAARWYGASREERKTFASRDRLRDRPTGDRRADANAWDDPEKHRRLVARLNDDFDGWAVALRWQSLPAYLGWVPEGTRICVWHKPNGVPSSSRIRTTWEPVLIWVPIGRRLWGEGPAVTDVLTCNVPPNGFVGAKPAAWTRWVLDVLGYDPHEDTVTDLFPGSGAVSSEIAQGVLL